MDQSLKCLPCKCEHSVTRKPYAKLGLLACSYNPSDHEMGYKDRSWELTNSLVCLFQASKRFSPKQTEESAWALTLIAIWNYTRMMHAGSMCMVTSTEIDTHEWRWADRWIERWTEGRTGTHARAHTLEKMILNILKTASWSGCCPWCWILFHKSNIYGSD